MFSYFPYRKLTHDETDNWEEHNVVLLNPDTESWNPNNEYYTEREAGMLDVDGDITMHATHELNEVI